MMMSYKDIRQFQEKSKCGEFVEFTGVRQYTDWLLLHGLQLQPEFKRVHKWNREKQIAYVEYLLQGGTNNRTIYINNPKWGYDWIRQPNFMVVDGTHRLIAVRDFLSCKIPAFDYYFRQYRDYPHPLIGLQFRYSRLQTEEEIIQWFLDLNPQQTNHSRLSYGIASKTLAALRQQRLITMLENRPRRRRHTRRS